MRLKGPKYRNKQKTYNSKSESQCTHTLLNGVDLLHCKKKHGTNIRSSIGYRKKNQSEENKKEWKETHQKWSDLGWKKISRNKKEKLGRIAIDRWRTVESV